MRRRGLLRRTGRGVVWALAFGIAMVVVSFAIPVAAIEGLCRAPAGLPDRETIPLGIADPDYRRPLTNSVLSYPEWYIVYAYQDFAGVLRDSDESAFNYRQSIADYWTGFCAVNRIARAEGGGEMDEKAMLYIIGVSFTAELAAKGAYETTVGHLFAWIRGPAKTNEDRFAARVADEYAGFLDQNFWYQFNFWGQVHALWRQVPFDRSSPARAIERRLALSAEWGFKSLYAQGIAALAGLSPSEPRIESVVTGLDPSDLVADPSIQIVRDLGEGRQLIETDRYVAFMKILTRLAAHGGQVLEIAGNRRILVTALVPPGTEVDLPGARPILADPVQSRPGWRRVGLDCEVPALAGVIQGLAADKAVLEHIYDY